MRVAQFRLLDLDGNEVIVGSPKEILEKGYISKKTNLFAYVINKSHINKKYKVERLPDLIIEGKSEKRKNNVKKLRTIYGIYKGDEEIARGTQKELCEKGYCNKNTVLAGYAKRHTYLNDYQVRIIGSMSLTDGKLYPYINRQAAKKPQIPELEYLLVHLKKYGNTFTRVNPSEYTGQLKEKGIDIDIQQFKDHKGIGYLVNRV